MKRRESGESSAGGKSCVSLEKAKDSGDDFFFSSRRRHTRFDCDWSSDVCSSDLITQSNRVVIPVGSYLRGELLESKRPGRIKGRGEFRLRLDTLILPNGYTVSLNAAPRSADSGGKETMDSEGKVTGGGGEGKDVGTVAQTTSAGAGICAIAHRVKGLGIGAGIGAAPGLAALLLTRGPEAELPRRSPLDGVLEHDVFLGSQQVQFDHL